MNTVAVRSLKDKIVVTLDKTASNVDLVLRFMERLDIEESTKRIDFSSDILKISKEIKSTWWKAHKKKMLK